MHIYLSGGMRPRPTESFAAVFSEMAKDPRLATEVTNFTLRPTAMWTDIVRSILPYGHKVFDPRVSNTKVFEDYSVLDVLAVRQSDLVVAYLETENPSGMGLACEVAYAKGLGKTVILINEKVDDRYSRFVENFADRIVHQFSEAVPVLSRIQA